MRAVNKTCKEALDILLEGTKFTGHSDIWTTNNCYFVKQNRVQAINGNDDNTIINRWGGELFLNNYDITVNQRIGDDYGVEILYGRNMLDLGLTDDKESVVTRGKPVAFDGRRLPELYIDSPIINKYREINEAFIDMSDLKLKSDTSDGEDGFETEEELYSAMRERMSELYEGGLDKPTITGTVKVAPLENTEKYKYVSNLTNIGLGDTVTVHHKELDIDIKVRCVGYVWNILTKKYEDVTLGDYVKNYFEKQSDIGSRMDNILNKNGSVKGESLEGAINAMKAPLIAQKDIATKSDVIAWKTEVTDPDDPNFGCMISGTKGISISDRRTPDGRDWVYDLAISARGIIADLLIGKIVAGSGAYFDLNHGEIYFNKGLIRGKNSEWNLETGEIKSRLQDGSELIISPTKGFYNKFGNSERAYHHLSYTEFVTCPINQGELSIKLPNEFKGKDFMVLVSPVSAVVDSFKPTEALRNVGVAVSVDYKNAIIKPASNYEYIDIETKKTRKVKCWADILVVA
ncbi:phage tail spike protein [Clostridium baratii]